MGSVARLDPHQHIGDGGLQTHELDALAAQAPGRSNDTAFHDRVGQLAHVRLHQSADTFGKLQDDGQPHAGRHRRAPHDVVAIRRRFGQLEVRRTRFMRARALR